MIKRFARKQKRLAQVEWNFLLRQKVYDVLNKQLEQLHPSEIKPREVVKEGWSNWVMALKTHQIMLSETERIEAMQLRKELENEIEMGLEIEIDIAEEQLDRSAEDFLRKHKEEIENFRDELDRELDLGLINQQQYQDQLRSFFQRVQKKTDLPKMPDKPNVEEERDRLMDQFLSGEISEQQYKEEMKKWSSIRGFCKQIVNATIEYDVLVIWVFDEFDGYYLPSLISVDLLQRRNIKVPQLKKNEWIEIGWGLHLPNGFEAPAERMRGTEENLRQKMAQEAVERLRAYAPENPTPEEMRDWEKHKKKAMHVIQNYNYEGFFENPNIVPWPEEPGWEDDIALSVYKMDNTGKFNIIDRQWTEPIHKKEKEEKEEGEEWLDLPEYSERSKNLSELPDKPDIEEERNRLMDLYLSGEISKEKYEQEMKKWSSIKSFCKKAQDFQGGFDGFFGGGDMIGQQTNFSTPNSEGEPGPQSEQGFEAARQQQLEKIRLKKLEEAKKKINDNSKKT